MKCLDFASLRQILSIGPIRAALDRSDADTTSVPYLVPAVGLLWTGTENLR
jgi:hypothetical protein